MLRPITRWVDVIANNVMGGLCATGSTSRHRAVLARSAAPVDTRIALVRQSTKRVWHVAFDTRNAPKGK
ncbi:MAG: hypothetical protein U0X91_29810 [Spirosomataceae bacterium]